MTSTPPNSSIIRIKPFSPIQAYSSIWTWKFRSTVAIAAAAPPVGVRRIDLRAAAGRQRHPEVARNGEHRHMPGGRLDTDQDHRLGQHVIRIELRIVVRSE